MSIEPIMKVFYRAVMDGNVAEVSRILQERPDLGTCHLPLGTPIHISAKHGNFVLLNLLLERGVDINLQDTVAFQTPLSCAARHGHLEMVRYLLDRGAAMDTTRSVANPLITAIVSGHAEVARYLIERGIDIHAKYGEIQEDALEFAFQWGRLDIVELLRARGARNARFP